MDNFGHQSHLFLGGGGPGNDSIAIVYKFPIVTKVIYFLAATRIYIQFILTHQNVQWETLVIKVT